MPRYFKQMGSPTPLYIFNGTKKLDFEPAPDRSCGYKMVHNPDLCAEVDKAIAQQVGGVVEVQQAEYDEFLKKNSKPSLTPWREELGKGKLRKFAESHPQPPAEPVAKVKAPVKQVPATPGELFKPAATKR